MWGKSYYNSFRSGEFHPEKIKEENGDNPPNVELAPTVYKKRGRKKSSNIWSDKENEILLNAIENNRPLVEVLPLLEGRSFSSCRNHMRELRQLQQFPRKTPWRKEELDILKKYYPYIGKYCAKLIPTHSQTSCIWYASKLGIAFSPISTKAWSDEEIDTLKEYFSKDGCLILQRIKGRTYRECFIESVFYLNLPLPADGYETLFQFPLDECSSSWTEAEDEVLIRHKDCLNTSVAELCNHTMIECMNRLNYLGAYMIDSCWGKPWTKEESEILQGNYSKYGLSICELLPKRSPSSIRTKASRMGLKFTWSIEELSCLKQYYPIMGDKVSLLLPEKALPAILAQASYCNLKYEKRTDKRREGQSPE